MYGSLCFVTDGIHGLKREGVDHPKSYSGNKYDVRQLYLTRLHKNMLEEQKFSAKIQGRR